MGVTITPLVSVVRPCFTILFTVLQAVALAESEEEQQELQAEGGTMEKAETTLDSVPLSSGGVLPRTSKESTPGASSSKEGKLILHASLSHASYLSLSEANSLSFSVLLVSVLFNLLYVLQ